VLRHRDPSLGLKVNPYLYFEAPEGNRKELLSKWQAHQDLFPPVNCINFPNVAHKACDVMQSP
jgi:hypothetical protein